MIIDDLSGKITAKWVEKNIIQEEDQNLYTYGIKYGIVQAIHLIAMSIVGILWGMFFEVIIMMTAYIPLRMYAGGYHLQSSSKCFIFSILVLNIQLFVLKYAEIEHVLWIMGISSVLIMLLAPVQSPHNPLNRLEIKRHRQTAIILVIIEALFVIELYYGLCYYQMCSVITMAVFTCSILLVIEKIRALTLRTVVE